jgi:SanA protein
MLNKIRISGMKILKWAFVALILFIGLLIYSNYAVVRSSKDYIYTNAGEVPQSQAALVLGALVYGNGQLYFMTKDRADMAIALYKAGKVKKILVSGDHGHDNYDEVNTIRNYILKTGIPPQDVFMDHAGFNTYASMYRARDIFKVESMIVCTQQFHLNRAVFLARSMGIPTTGIAVEKIKLSGRSMAFSKLRETGARLKAWLEADIFRPKPHFLGDPIPINGDGRLTEDGK